MEKKWLGNVKAGNSNALNWRNGSKSRYNGETRVDQDRSEMAELNKRSVHLHPNITDCPMGYQINFKALRDFEYKKYI